MSPDLPRHLLRLSYEEAAEAYLRSLPPEHFMEATEQGTQRKITLESLDLVHGHRPDVQVFNELLVQYPRSRQRQPGQVVPDNMVVVWPEPIRASGSYDMPFQPTKPLLVLEYVSKNSKRKDYEESFQKYERHLKVPYYLAFYPDDQELTLFHHNGRKYVSTKPNEQGRLGIPELDLEVALLDGWVRYWYKGELLPLPVELQREVEVMRRERDEARQSAANFQQQAEEQARRAEEEAQRAEQQARRAEEERKARLAAEQELAQLKAQLENLRSGPKRGP